MKKLSIVALTVLVLLGVAIFGPTDARALTFTYENVFNGSTPTSTKPWLTADFEQDGTDKVELTITSSLEVSAEYIDQIAFNIDPSIVPSGVTITRISGPGVTIDHTTQNAQNLNGAGSLGFDFDIKFDYPSAAGSRFNGAGVTADVSVIDFTATGLTPNSFFFMNPSNYYTGAHIAGIPVPGTDQTTSGAVYGTVEETVPPPGAIPEPTTLLLVGSGLVGLALFGRSRRKK